MKSEHELQLAIDCYGSTVKRICMVHLKNYADTEDIFQEVFLKYMLRETPFESSTHEKAWILRVAINACIDQRRRFFNRKAISLEELVETADYLQETHKELLLAVLDLPMKYRQVIYLYYYEGYTVNEIGRILHRNENTVYTHLTRARNLLRQKLQ